MSFRRIEVHQHSTNFRQATRIATSPIPQQLQDDEVLLRNEWVGINASDINHTSGKYKIGQPLPYDAGFESIGRVAKAGRNVTHLKEGDAVGCTAFGSFTEFQVVKAHTLLKLPTVTPSFLPLLVSGLTASIALEQLGGVTLSPADQSKRKKVVLVTAAAGGTGTFAVQLAKLAGCHVIGTCGSEAKVQFLHDLGCDRVVNYNREDLSAVLQQNYPRGVDVIYESVGGEMFDVCVKHLAVKGSLIVIGMISTYKEGIDNQSFVNNVHPLSLLQKSASIRGFFLNHYIEHFQRHLTMLTQLIANRQLNPVVDAKSFVGLEQVADAIDYLYEGKNMGKVVVQLVPQSSL